MVDTLNTKLWIIITEHFSGTISSSFMPIGWEFVDIRLSFYWVPFLWNTVYIHTAAGLIQLPYLPRTWLLSSFHRLRISALGIRTVGFANTWQQLFGSESRSMQWNYSSEIRSDVICMHQRLCLRRRRHFLQFYTAVCKFPCISQDSLQNSLVL